jgi:para-nitrobenzyl esterase
MIRLVATASIAAVLAPSLSSATIVAPPAGRVRGTNDGVVAEYRGIPYAVPPLGDLRWREPQPVKRWTGVRQANAFAPACMQTGTSMPGEAPPVTSEDCLYLNIWAPSHARRAPVIVWIHGGGFMSGNASMPLYWGDQLARRGAIVVTFGYRLGPLGFLAYPGLTAESPRHTSGNYGLLDQIAALRWVKSNIAAFGGDPLRVTIAGQSAGAISVSLLMATPSAKDLFARAIAQSGGLFEPIQLAPGYKLDRAEQDGESYARSVGARSVADLRALTAATLLGGSAGSVSHPVIDHAVLPRSPYDAYVAGAQNDVPILVGSNSDEARSLVPDIAGIRAATFEEDITRVWGSLPPALLAAYPHGTDEQAVAARLGFERDLRFGWDMWAWARLQASRSTNPVYYYHFDAQPPFPANSVYSGWGPSHYAELWYMFDHLGQEPWAWTPSDRQLAQTMASYWVNFARNGTPEGPGLPAWPAYTMAKPAAQYLGRAVREGLPGHLETMKVFDGTYAAVRGRPFGADPDR